MLSQPSHHLAFSYIHLTLQLVELHCVFNTTNVFVY